MDSSFLFFFVGTAVYLADLFSGRLGDGSRTALFTGTGCLAGLALLAVPGIRHPAAGLPVYAPPLLGALAGFLIDRARKGGWIEKPGLKYLSTLIPGLILGAFGFALYHLNALLSPGPDTLPAAAREPSLVFVWSVLAGFLMIFGYTFPSRMFKKNPAPPENGEEPDR